MKNLKNKKGISLIVLILTIIVMIILATAIILSLNNSGIIGKANKAKTDSDYASLKEYANVLQAEYELMSDKEKENTGYGSSIDYANAKLASEGYKQRLNDDGILLTEAAVYAIDNNIQIGDEITGYNKYLTVGKVSKTDGKENNVYNNDDLYDVEIGENTPNNVTCTGFTTWRYIGINDEGEVMIAPDMTDSSMPEMTLSGLGTFAFGPERINEVCKELYSTSIGSAEGMNLKHVVNILEYIGYRSKYWIIDCSDYDTNGYCSDVSVPIKESLSINELLSEELRPFSSYYGPTFSDDLSYFIYTSLWSSTPEDVLPFDLFDVKIECTSISSTSTDINTERADLIFFEGVNYWLASRSINNSDSAYPWYRCDAVTGLTTVNGVNYDDGTGFYLANEAPRTSLYIRPVVSLSGSVTLSSVSDGVWSIN